MTLTTCPSLETAGITNHWEMDGCVNVLVMEHAEDIPPALFQLPNEPRSCEVARSQELEDLVSYK